MKISRRKILAGSVAAIAGATVVEYESFTGAFDHRRSPGAEGKDQYLESRKRISSGAEGVLHVGHSTHLIALGGLTFLTDPWFYDPAFGALSHEVKPAVLPSELGKLDVILITHDHADHADLRALAEMDKSAAVVVDTEELAKKLRGVGFANVAVMAVGEKKSFGPCEVTAVEAVHDIYEIGYVVTRGRGERSVYFAGDTAINPAIAKIGQTLKPTMSILPCDGTRLTGSAQLVMTPQDAVEATKQLGSKIVIPSHAEAYFSDPIAEHILATAPPRPRETFAAGVETELRDQARCIVPRPGELVVL